MQYTSPSNIGPQLARWVMFLDQRERVLLSGLEVVVCGDMNINHLDWAAPSDRQSSQTKKLKSLIEQLFNRILPHNVSQCVTVPTRVMNGQPETGLDHFYTNRPDKLSPIQTQFWGGSDHKLILATRFSKVIRTNVRYVKKRSYKNFHPQEFLEEVAKIRWLEIYQCESVDSAVQLFSEKLTKILDKLAPVKTVQTRTRYAPWLSQSTKLLIEQRDQAQRKASSSKLEEDWKLFRRLRNQVTSKLRVEKVNWQQDKLIKSSDNPGEQWQFVLGWLDWKSAKSPSQLFHNGRMMNKPSEIADCQNDFFINKVADIRRNLPPQVSDPLAKLKFLMRNRTCRFKLKAVHPETVEQILSNLKNSKSCGLDSIDTYCLKLAGQHIIPALTHIVNLSIETQQFPTKWKTAKIIPLHKKDDPLNPKNYRPVAILPILSKILEKAVFIQMIDYMDTNHLLHPNHHGFRAGHSTTGLIQMYDSWVEAIDRDQYTGACFLDLSAAFDIVDHPLLLEKLKLYGFSDTSLQWFSSYLSGRSQTVYIESFLSKTLPVPTGVPQGSILGPLFYIIFTNELPELIHEHQAQKNKTFNVKCPECGNLCCYADDSTFSFSSTSIATISAKVTEQYSVISEFMSNNMLKLNGDKTHLMLLATENAWRSKLDDNSITLNTGQEIIHTSKTEQLLGGLIQQNLKWSEHILLNKDSLIKN